MAAGVAWLSVAAVVPSDDRVRRPGAAAGGEGEHEDDRRHGDAGDGVVRLHARSTRGRTAEFTRHGRSVGFALFERGRLPRPCPPARRWARLIPTKSVGIPRGPGAASPGPRSADEDRPLTHRTSFHGSGAVAFSTKGEYGVRLMVQLGRRYGTGPASLAEIAADEDLPRAYLEQLVTSLRDAGLVVSTRGARGGYELARAAGPDPDERRSSAPSRARSRR